MPVCTIGAQHGPYQEKGGERKHTIRAFGTKTHRTIFNKRNTCPFVAVEAFCGGQLKVNEHPNSPCEILRIRSIGRQDTTSMNIQPFMYLMMCACKCGKAVGGGRGVGA